jgi:hypothetical protein
MRPGRRPTPCPPGGREVTDKLDEPRRGELLAAIDGLSAALANR